MMHQQQSPSSRSLSACIGMATVAAEPAEGGGVAGGYLVPTSDPLDFFGAIRELVERGLSAEERAAFGPMDGVDQKVSFRTVAMGSDAAGDREGFLPADTCQQYDALKREKSEVERRLEELESQLRESKERSAMVRRTWIY